MRLVGVLLAAFAALLVWTVLVAAAARGGWWRAMPAAKGDAAGFLEWAESRYAAESKGNVAIALLEHGELAGTFFASHGRAVDGDSLFQVASLSKWITAWGVMTLVEQQRIDLDAPVSRYLTRWRLPPSEFDDDGVTVRRLLAHTAGLTDGLGFRGYAVSPHLVAHHLTTSSFYAILSKSGKAMFVDYGSASGTHFANFERATAATDRIRFVEHDIDDLKEPDGTDYGLVVAFYPRATERTTDHR